MRTIPNLGTKDTPFSIVFGHEAVILTEIGTKTFRVSEYIEEASEQVLRKDLDLIEERIALTCIKFAVRKQHVANY